MTEVHIKSGDAPVDMPLFSFGVLADVQYADIDNKQNFEKSAWRCYRQSLTLLKNAVHKWNTSVHPINFILQLGDLIDGFCTLSNSSQDALEVVQEVLSAFSGPQGVHHTLGNHEFYNFSRDVLLQGPLNSNPKKEERCSYYSFSPYKGFRVVVLDTYDFSLIGNPEGTSEHQQALDKLKACNPNEDLASPNGLTGLDRRFSKVNGAVGDAQLGWLNDTLTSADQRHEQIIVIGHIPVYEQSSYPFCMLWNYDEVLKIFHQHRCVLAYLAGHDHSGGYAVDDRGIHHVTLRGVVEAVSKEDPTVTAHVYNGRLELYNLGARIDPIDKVVIELKPSLC